MKQILVILGGTSRERQVSLSSGKACIKALKNLKYKVRVFDPAKQHFSEIQNDKDEDNLTSENQTCFGCST